MRVDPVRSVAEELPAQAAWMRRLARGLTRDEATAEDVAQDAWVAALRRAPEREGVPRSWLSRVASNFARKGWRDRAARERIERAVAREEATPAADEIVARLDLQRALADELRALREPYRTTLLRHYFDGWSSARIAREQGVPAATVRSRVQHGLAELRARLDRRCAGDRSVWRLALLPLASGPWPRWLGKLDLNRPLSAAHGVLAMKGALQLAVAGAVALAVGVGAWWGFDAPRASAPTTSEDVVVPQVSARAQPVTETTDARAAASLERVAIEPPANSEPIANVEVVAQPTRVDARCVDANSRPVAGARLTIGGFDEPAAFSGADGRVTLDLGADGGRNVFVVQAAGLATVFADAHYAKGATTHLGDLVLGAAGAVSGRVVNRDGIGIANARVTIAAADSWTHDIETAKRAGPRLSDGAPNAVTRADGSFIVEGVVPGGARAWGAVEGLRFAMSEPLTVRENAVTEDVVLVLDPLEPEDEITGVVLAPDGVPVPHAMLGLRVAEHGATNVYAASVDEHGRFHFRLLASAPHQITAADPEHRWQDARVADVQPGARDVEVRFAENRYVDVAVRSSSNPVARFALVSLREKGGDDAAPIERVDDGPHENGRSRIRVPTQRFSIQVVAPGFALEQRGPFDPEAPPASLDFELAPEPGIAGKVTANGTALAGAKVSLWKVATARQEVEVYGYPALVEPTPADAFVTDDDGAYFLRVREPGQFVVRAQHSAHAPNERGPIAAQPAVGVADFDLELGLGGVIAGRVLAPPGRSSEGVLIAINRGDAHARTVRSDERGEFRFERVMPGRWYVSRGRNEIVEGAGQSWSIGSARRATEIPFNCAVNDGRTTRVDVDLRDYEPCVLAGTLTLNGAAVSGWTLEVWPGDASSVTGDLPSASTDERGDFEVVVAEPGRARVEFAPPTEAGQQGSLGVLVELKRGPNEWNAELSVGRIEGRMLAPQLGGELLYYVTRGGATTCTLAVRPDQRGDFVLPYVPAGAGEFSRLEHHGEDSVNWIPVTKVEVARGETRRVDLP